MRLESLESRRLRTSLPYSYWPSSSPIDDAVTIKVGEEARIDLLRKADSWNRADAGERSIDSVGDPLHGSHQLLADGRTLIYTPDEGFTGVDQFTYVGIDPNGANYEGSVAINVADPIVAIPDWFHVDQGQSDIVLDVTANDGPNIDPGYFYHGGYYRESDSSPDISAALKIKSVETPSAGGSITISDGGSVLNYTPADGFSGLETLTYTVQDSDGFTATTFVDIRVSPNGQYDTSGWSEWWKHQIIASSLNSNFGFGQVAGERGYVHYDVLVDDNVVDFADGLILRDAPQFSMLADSHISSTNVQVSGVDQGDLVKTDGRFIYVIRNRVDSTPAQLMIFDAEDPNSLPLVSKINIEGDPQELLLLGDTVVLVSQDDDVRVVTLDITDRASPILQGSSAIPGTFRESRLIDGVVQVFVNLPSNHYAVSPESICADGTEICFVETRQQLLDRILGDESLRQAPAITDFDSDSNISSTSSLQPHIQLIGSNSLLVGAIFDGPSRSGLVLGSADRATVYVSGQNVVVFGDAASTAFTPWSSSWMGPSVSTLVHQFQLGDDGLAWVAQGEIDGHLLNSFSVGDHDGYFYAAIGRADQSNEVVVLQQEGNQLAVIGQTEPLAQGERIYSARFVEDRAYVVTFRQIDPLFVIDLSNPEDPVVTGELKMPGYSQYLHPMGDTHLIGVGRETNDWGRVLGMEVSLFDVSDPTNPIVDDKLPLGGVASPLAYGRTNLSDHRAFSYFDSHQILALPISVEAWRSQGESSVLLLRIDPESGISEVGKIEFDDSRVLRTFRIGDVIYSLSDTEIQAHDLNDPSTPLIRRSLIDSETSSQPTEPDPTNDPTVSTAPVSTVTAAADDPMDVSGDGNITLVDALMVINRLIERTETANLTTDAREYDVNGDDAITANDALILINFVNDEHPRGQAIAELLAEDDDRRSSDDEDLRWAIDDAQWSIDPERTDMLS
jgi:inhibitor of cysteine peptidase